MRLLDLVIFAEIVEFIALKAHHHPRLHAEALTHQRHFRRQNIRSGPRLTGFGIGEKPHNRILIASDLFVPM